MLDLRTHTLSHRRILLLGILVFAAVARLATIGQGTNIDEGYFLLQGREAARGHLPFVDTQLNKGPLIAWFVAPFFLLSDTPVVPTRLAVVVVAVLGIWGAARLARRWWGGEAALLVAAWYGLESYAALWGKCVHVSVLLPAMSVWVLNALDEGCDGLQESPRKSSLRAWNLIASAGLLLGLCGMLKQTAVFLIPVVLFRVAQFRMTQSVSGQNRVRFTVRFLGIFGGMALLPWAVLIVVYAVAGHLPALFDDLFSAHFRMRMGFDHPLDYRLGEMFRVMVMSPFLWLTAFVGGVAILVRSDRKGWVAVLWFLAEFLGNGFSLGHFWRHYLFAALPAAALLAGYATISLTRRFAAPTEADRPQRMWIAVGVIAVLSLVWWPKQFWGYPGLTLREEARLAETISERIGDGPFLNLMNPAVALWADRDLPQTVSGDRTLRVPGLYPMISRGYLSEADLMRSIESWRRQGVCGAAIYGKDIRALVRDPKLKMLKPLARYLVEDFPDDSTVAFETEKRKTSYMEIVVFARRSDDG